MNEINAILIIAFRDFLKLLRDRARIVISLIFPMIFIGVLGGSLQANLSKDVGFNFLTFTFLGVIAQTLFSSTASGVISLIEDRQNDFSQEIFISPISRYSIIIGKIIGESLVSMTQLIGILIFGMILGIPLTLTQFFILFPFFLIICLFVWGSFWGVDFIQSFGSKICKPDFSFYYFPTVFFGRSF